ncbi:MAG: TonB-dependent receptor, partial [Prolixibacteraceae bacterium]|nr:TonB-dependent receptor [Prolixibacteraceae bacterium]
NPEMINGLEVYKGGFPAKYGGKLSSIVSITQREGDNSKTKGSLSFGVTDASFSIEGPLLNKKASFIVTGRKTLIDPLMILISALANGGDFYVFYGFHDINGKLSYHPDNKNNFYLNIYQGDDYINYWNKKEKITDERFRLGNTWGNWLVSARWNRLFSPRLFADNTLSYTRYRLNVLSSYYSKTSSDTIDFKYKYTSTVQDVSLRSDWQFKFMKNWDIDYGAKATLYTYIPNKTTQNGKTTNLGFDKINAVELSLYLSNRFTLFNKVNGDVGARLVNYNSDGLNEFAIEPRLMLNARIFKNQTLNITFQKVNQFSHLAFTSGSILNNEVWIPAGKDIAPSNSNQFSIGWKGTFFNGTIETEVNAYYKELNQLATYKEGYTNLLGDGGWLNKVETGGTGKAKGIELMIRKVKGKWTGFIGYTLSKSTRQYPGINKGNEYLFEYDRPHSLSLNINHRFNEKWSVNASWVYQSGIPYTPVIGRQISPSVNQWDGSVEYTEAFIYGERNSERMRSYHRLDIGANLTTKTKKGRKAVWTFSVYNLYNRHNPAAYYYGSEDDTFFYRSGLETDQPVVLNQISYFPIIPTVSYKVFFE